MKELTHQTRRYRDDNVKATEAGKEIYLGLYSLELYVKTITWVLLGKAGSKYDLKSNKYICLLLNSLAMYFEDITG